MLWKRVLKQVFRQGKELQEDVMPLSNAFSNRLNNIADTFNKEDIISQRQNRNMTSLQLLGTGKNQFAGHSKREFERGKAMKNRNKNMSKICFFD